MQPRVLMPADCASILHFATSALAATHADPMEREMQSWNARWRAEALEHYLKLGWSFGIFDGDELRGFVLGQPLLFFRGLTQTLWIEHVEAPTPAIAETLLQAAVNWARDKHLQCVLHEDADGGIKMIKTTRFQ